MTQRFILDENIVILAEKVESDRGESDSTCIDLINQIIDICHSIVLDPNLWEKWHSQLLALGRIGTDGLPSLLRT